MAKKYISPLLDIVSAEFETLLADSYGAWDRESRTSDVEVVNGNDEEGVNAKDFTWGDCWSDIKGW